jgi:hypothetical protein
LCTFGPVWSLFYPLQRQLSTYKHVSSRQRLQKGSDWQRVGEEIIDLAVPWDGCCLSSSAIDVQRVFGAFPKRLAPTLLEVLDQITPFHTAVIVTGSRITSCPSRDSWMRARFASMRLPRVSSRVAPWVLAPGNSSTNPIYPSGTFLNTAVNYTCMLFLAKTVIPSS